MFTMIPLNNFGQNHKRIAIIGNQGAGKTTLARTLEGIMGIEYILVDWAYIQKSQAEIDALYQRMANNEAWIIDGDFCLLPLADLVIYLDYPLYLCIWRALLRAFHWSRFSRSPRNWKVKSISDFTGLIKNIFGVFRFLFEIPWKPQQASCQLGTLQEIQADRLAQPAAGPIDSQEYKTKDVTPYLETAIKPASQAYAGTARLVIFKSPHDLDEFVNSLRAGNVQ